MTGLWATLELAESAERAPHEPAQSARAGMRARSTRIAAHLLARKCAYELGVAPRDFQLSYDNFGQPRLENGLRMSLAHSGNVIAAAVGETPCGIDIEPRPERDSATRRALVAAAEILGSAPVEAAKRWVVLESFAKLTGRGLAPLLDDSDRAEFFASDDIPIRRWHNAADSLHTRLLRSHEAVVRVDVTFASVSALALAGDSDRWHEICVGRDELQDLSDAGPVTETTERRFSDDEHHASG